MTGFRLSAITRARFFNTLSKHNPLSKSVDVTTSVPLRHEVIGPVSGCVFEEFRGLCSRYQVDFEGLFG
jgi:hypothetical protein